MQSIRTTYKTSDELNATSTQPSSTGGQEIQLNLNTTIIPTATQQQNTSQVENTEPRKAENGERKVLMHFAYLHPQEHQGIAPTHPPAPTPPLRIEPQSKFSPYMLEYHSLRHSCFITSKMFYF